MDIAPALKQRIETLIAKEPVVLFMKGTRDAPRCGFSAAVVEILDELVPSYATVDVLADPDLREGIKAFSSWPTIPQLFVRGEFLGGADIAKEMFGSGELQKKLGVSAPVVEAGPLTVTLSAKAADVLRAAHKEQPAGQHLRLGVSAKFRHQLGFGPAMAGDATCESEGIVIHVDGASRKRAHGVRIDAVDAPGGGVGFRIDNPNEPASVKVQAPREVKARLDAATAGNGRFGFFDVRTPGEVAIATITGSVLLDDAGRAALEALPKDTPLVFFCHHGGRSQAAAEHYLAQGYTDVTNIAGGIEAWSIDVDPSVPRY